MPCISKFMETKYKLTIQPFTLVALGKELSVNEKTVERDIEGLKRSGRIRFVGPKCSGRYELPEK